MTQENLSKIKGAYIRKAEIKAELNVYKRQIERLTRQQTELEHAISGIQIVVHNLMDESQKLGEEIDTIQYNTDKLA